MKIDRPLRMPLQPGDMSVGTAVMVAVVGGLLFAPHFFLRQIPKFLHIPSALLRLGWLIAVVVVAVWAWRRRASDVVLDEHGLRVIGGPHHGRRFDWGELKAGQAQVQEDGLTFSLRLGGLTLARTESPEEAESLRALCVTLDAAGRDRPVPAPLRPEVVRCRGCDAALVPADAHAVACRYCGATTELPEEVRGIAALRASREATARALEVLLHWWTARRLNVLLAVSFLPMVLAWPLIAVLFVVFIRPYYAYGVLDLITLVLCAVHLSLTLPGILASQILHRRSIELIAVEFRAQPPEQPGAPWMCRSCQAPLAEEPGASSAAPRLVPCVYCQSDNVVGLALARTALAERAQAASLAPLVQARTEELHKLRRSTWLSAGLLAYSALYLANLVAGLSASR